MRSGGKGGERWTRNLFGLYIQQHATLHPGARQGKKMNDEIWKAPLQAPSTIKRVRDRETTKKKSRDGSISHGNPVDLSIAAIQPHALSRTRAVWTVEHGKKQTADRSNEAQQPTGAPDSRVQAPWPRAMNFGTVDPRRVAWETNTHPPTASHCPPSLHPLQIGEFGPLPLSLCPFSPLLTALLTFLKCFPESEVHGT